MLGPERGGFGRGLTSIEERNECQQGRWALKGVDYEISHRGVEQMSANEDARP